MTSSCIFRRSGSRHWVSMMTAFGIPPDVEKGYVDVRLIMRRINLRVAQQRRNSSAHFHHVDSTPSERRDPCCVLHNTPNTNPTNSLNSVLPLIRLSRPIPSTTIRVSLSFCVLMAEAICVASVWPRTSSSGIVPPKIVVAVS